MVLVFLIELICVLLFQLTGFLQPTSGTAFIDGLDIISDMDKIYKKIGVCPQHEYESPTYTFYHRLLFLIFCSSFCFFHP